MATSSINFIHHFSHEGHPLKLINADQEFLCDGCKTPGRGKRYRCNGCNFDLHEYCGTCPRLLPSYMHRHPLHLVVRKPRQIDRICDVCRDRVEGMFYQCKECEFDVHPLCTQLPQKLNHALHKTHPLVLQYCNSTPNNCSVCRNSCNCWQYRCQNCNFNIHLECVLSPVVPCPPRGIPFQPPPQFAPYYGQGYPTVGHFGSNFNTYMGDPYVYPQQNFVQLPAHNYPVGGSSNNGSGQLGKSMFSLVGQLGFGVLSNMIFGVDIPSVFAGWN